MFVIRINLLSTFLIWRTSPYFVFIQFKSATFTFQSGEILLHFEFSDSIFSTSLRILMFVFQNTLFSNFSNLENFSLFLSFFNVIFLLLIFNLENFSFILNFQFNFFLKMLLSFYNLNPGRAPTTSYTVPYIDYFLNMNFHIPS